MIFQLSRKAMMDFVHEAPWKRQSWFYVFSFFVDQTCHNNFPLLLKNCSSYLFLVLVCFVVCFDDFLSGIKFAVGKCKRASMTEVGTTELSTKYGLAPFTVKGQEFFLFLTRILRDLSLLCVCPCHDVTSLLQSFLDTFQIQSSGANVRGACWVKMKN